MTTLGSARIVALGMLLASCDEVEPEGPKSTLLDAGTNEMVSASVGERPATIRFAAQLAGKPLACGQRYDSPSGSIQVQDLRLFVHDVQLLDATGEATPLKQAPRLPWQTDKLALLDFTDGAGACSSGSLDANTLLTGTVPADRSYRGIRFKVGVPDPLNNSDPARQVGPLQAPGAHWSWRDGYRYLMAELLLSPTELDAGVPSLVDASLPDAGSEGLESATFVHLGATACDGTAANGFHCERPNRAQIELRDFDPLAGKVVLDVSALFAGVDLTLGSQCHGTGASCDAFYGALGIEPATGQPGPMQRAFRGE